MIVRSVIALSVCVLSGVAGAFLANPRAFSALRPAESSVRSVRLAPPVQAPLPAPIPAPLPALALPIGSTCLPNPSAPLVVETKRIHDVPMTLIEGGTPGTRRALMRQGVPEFVQQSGATAGLNGTFFANALVSGTDNTLIGPTLCGNETDAVYSPYDKKPDLDGRPLVLLSPQRTGLVPYDPATMDDLNGLKALMPDLTDAFLGGVWLVHDGVAADDDRMDSFHVKDANDPRRRAFFALMPDGRPVLGATTWVTTSKDLAIALQGAGVQEAVLLDSGFSTSLVYQNKILVTGHTSPGIPSRPVPHAVVLFGKPADPVGVPLKADAAAVKAAPPAATS